MDSAFDVLKLRLLLERLDDVASVTLHAQVIHEAGVAAALARSAGYPLLLFPCLFEERTQSALNAEQHRRAQYWHTLSLGRVNLASPAIIEPPVMNAS